MGGLYNKLMNGLLCSKVMNDRLLCKIFHKIWYTEEIPDEWKKA